MVSRVALVLAMLGGQLASQSRASEVGCARLLAQPDRPAGSGRPIKADDLIELADIGFPDAALTGPSPLAVSPDGTSAAFVLSRADRAANSYCIGLVTVRLDGVGRARVVDSGGEFIPLTSFVRGLEVTVGLQRPNVPAWSPDGRSIAYLKRKRGRTQVFVAPAGGGEGRFVTASATDIEQVAWLKDGRILFVTRPSAIAAAETIDREGQAGWLYDDRFTPHQGPRPRLKESDVPPAMFVIDVASGAAKPAGAAELALFGQLSDPISAGGARARFERDETSLVAPRRLSVQRPGEGPVRCRADACSGSLSGPWWSSDGSQVLFARREGWNNETTSFYRWRPSAAAPVKAYSTLDSIQNCVPAGAFLLCTSENPAQPRQIVLLDLAAGRTRLVFDPNPGFRAIRLPPVCRLHWRNHLGLEAWGDLVLPKGASGRSRLPLVIVQYNSRGFLRGGTGNEFPIYLLAQRGFAVLSFERPKAVAATVPGLADEVALNAANERGWAERKSIHSAILAGVEEALKTGRIDRKRIGITGLSDGATAARYALVNSNLFAAAAIGSCCIEPQTAMTYGGPAWAAFNRAIGYPPASEDRPDFWRPVSLAVNAGRIKTPLLMQLADDEYLLGLEAFTALKEHNAPVELAVFPGEHHVKWQPIHLAAAYERALDWFAFWLRCEIDPSAAKRAQYERWKAMRPATDKAASLCP